MARPLFTIILPAHNRADVLPFAIGSCLAQTVRDFELLVVGDGCTDGTAAFVRAQADPRIRWFDLPKAPGFGYAHRNFALREARGEFIAWQAHDDLWLPDHLETVARSFRDEKIEWAHSRPLWVTPDGLLCPASFVLDDPATLRLFLAHAVSMLAANCVAHRSACVEKYGFWNEALPEGGDWDYWARIIGDGGRRNFAVVHEVTALHFRAIWRTAAGAGSRRLQTWVQWHGQNEELSAALRASVPEGMTEQEALWRAIAPDAAGWTARLRAAVQKADASRLAWDETRWLETKEPALNLARIYLAQKLMRRPFARPLRAFMRRLTGS